MGVTRSESRNLTLHLDYLAYNTAVGHSLVSYYTSDRTVVLTGSVTHGDNLPDWRRRIALGISATTTLVGTSQLHVEVQPGELQNFANDVQGKRFLRKRWVGDILSQHVAAQGVSTSLDGTADQRAASKFLSRYIDLKNTWRGANFAAEIRETWHMLRHPLQAFYHRTWTFAGQVKKLKKVHYQDKLSLSKAVSDAWLAFVFGARPLAQDCEDARKALERLKNGTGHDQKVISAFGRNLTYSSNPNFNVTYPGTWVAHIPGGFSGWSNLRGHQYVNTMSSVRYLVAVKAAPSDRSTAAEQFGFGVFDIVPAVWEAIPWSFFIDYFANIGELLDSCRLWGADIGWCNRTVRNSTATTIRDLSFLPASAADNYVVGNPRLFALGRYVSRSQSSIPMPTFHFKLPGLDSLKWLNIAALARQCYGN